MPDETVHDEYYIDSIQALNFSSPVPLDLASNCLPNILIVNDEAMTSEVIKSMLVSLNQPCDTALSGPEAIKKLNERIELCYKFNVDMFKIVIIDINQHDELGAQLAL